MIFTRGFPSAAHRNLSLWDRLRISCLTNKGNAVVVLSQEKPRLAKQEIQNRRGPLPFQQEFPLRAIDSILSNWYCLTGYVFPFPYRTIFPHHITKVAESLSPLHNHVCSGSWSGFWERCEVMVREREGGSGFGGKRRIWNIGPFSDDSAMEIWIAGWVTRNHRTSIPSSTVYCTDARSPYVARSEIPATLYTSYAAILLLLLLYVSSTT